MNFPGLATTSRSGTSPISGWVVAVAITWGVLVVASAALSHYAGADATSCLFRNATGQPCATCGGTRATIELARGDMLAALRLNPLVTLAWFAVPLGGIWLIQHRRRGLTRIDTGREQRLWIAAGMVFVANWAYLIVCRPF